MSIEPCMCGLPKERKSPVGDVVMARIIRVSQQGLSQCPGCKTHIRIEDNLEETQCPFCQTALLARPAGVAPAKSVLKGRGAKMALALFGTAAVIGACVAPVAPLYGAPPQDGQVQADAGPADNGAADAGEAVVEAAPTPTPAPKYGAPPSP